jgi:hypothetical protein
MIHKTHVFNLLACLLMAMCLFSCSKEFSSNAPYKDVTVVYGILDADETDHYIKIYKGFLTDGNAFEAAQEYDSLYYFDKIDVVMEEYNGTHLNATIPLKDTVVERDDMGDFAAPDQLVYHFSRTLNRDYTYRLVITNRETGRTITAETPIIGSFFLSSPSDHTSAVGIHGTMKTDIKYSQPANAYSYDVYQTFYYIERNKVTQEEVRKSIRRKINPRPATTTTVQYIPAVLLNVIASNVKPDPTVDRYISVDSCLKFEVWAASETLYNYVVNNSISGSVVLDKLDYTNIQCEDGRVTGILASRRHVEGWHGLTTPSQEELVHGEITGNLGFHYAWEYAGH